jgi:cobalt-precorrin 5A hydrolase/precorrin-3B C17-methyltransferase
MSEPVVERQSGDRILCCSVTAAGAALARRLPYEHVHGSLIDTVTARWAGLDALVVIGATGIAVRAVAPLLTSKATDPAVISVDDAGKFAVALTGGHVGGANALAREVAALLGAEAVVTTATDRSGRPGLDDIPGFTATGPVAAVTRRWLDGETLVVERDSELRRWELRGWELPAALTGTGKVEVVADVASADGRGIRVLITDRTVESDVDQRKPPESDLVVRLHPRSLVIGVGASSGADSHRLASLVDQTLAGAGLAPESVGAIATLDRKAEEPAIVSLAERWGVEIRTFPAAQLADVDVPTPSSVVAAAVGTPSVSEAAALLAAGADAILVVAKQISVDSTVAVARRARPEGHLSVVGLGPGLANHRTSAASAAVRHAEVVIGYGPYVDQAAELLRPGQTVLRSPIGAETERCVEALDRAAAGQSVALVCSGDAGVYAMASLVCELAPSHGDPPLTVVPGVTASLAAAAVLGAPLGHDHCNISLSDLLTPWDLIERRLHAAGAGDFVVSLYNPRSRARHHQLPRALEILGSYRDRSTPAAILTDVGRADQRIVRTTLGGLDPEAVDMLSLVVVGSSITRWIGTRMVTPRGYRTVHADAPSGLGERPNRLDQQA